MPAPDPHHWIQVFAVVAAAVFASVCGTFLALRLARRVGFMSHPNPIVAQHRRPVAYLGGAGVAAGTVAGVALAGPSAFAGTLGCGLAFLVLGTLDDLKAFSPGPKFLLQAIAAAVAVGFGTVAAPTGWGPADAAISWFVICAMVNAFNFVDVSDGLLASVSAVAFLVVASLFPSLAVPAAACAGASLGFLAFNRPPAVIFLGDGGSHFLGFMAAATMLHGVSATGRSSDWLALLLIFSIPAFELAFITVARISLGLPWWRGSPDHFALRMQGVGWTAGQVAAVAAGLALAIGALSGFGRGHGAIGLGAVTIVVLSAAAFAWNRLWRMPRPVRPPSQP